MKKKSNIEYSGNGKLRFVLLIMRLTFFLFLGFTFAVQANSYSQATKFSMSIKNATVEDVFREIESNSEFVIFFQDQHIDLNRKVKMKVRNQGIENVLGQLFEGTENQWEIDDRQIIIYRELSELDSREALISVQQQEAQTIKGKVTEENGDPLIGVTVLVKNTTVGVATNMNGEYTINVPEGYSTLVFTFIGMVEQEIEISGPVLNVTLVPAEMAVDEVVVTALGIKRQKREIGYSQQGVKGDVLLEASAPDVISALSGLIAGAQISIPDGVEGSSTRIVIRGNNNIAGDNQPLIIIDGVYQSNDFIERNGLGGYTDWGTALNNLNSFDVENVEVLKGPAAAALYGSRGSNGVVIITSKKGHKTEGIGISVSSRYKITKATRYRDVQNTFGSGGPAEFFDGSYELPVNGDGVNILPGAWNLQHTWGADGLGNRAGYMDFSWFASGVSWGAKMEGQPTLWWDRDENGDQVMREFSPQPDNIKEYFETGTNLENNIAFSTAGDFGSIRISLTNLQHESVAPNSKYDQNTFNIGGVLNISEKVKANVAISYFEYERLNSPKLGDQNNSFGKAALYYYPRNDKILDKYHYENEDGSRYNQAGYGSVHWGNSQWLWWETYHNNTTLNRKKLLGSVSLDYNATDWLTFNAMVGLEHANEVTKYRQDPWDSFGLQGGIYKSGIKNNDVLNTDFRAMLYKDDILPDFNARLTFGGSTWSRSNYGVRGERDKNANVAYPWQFSFNNVQDRTTLKLYESFYDKKVNSGYGILNFSYKNYLFLELTGRNDWSSTLPTDVNSYFYPGGNLSFIASEAFNLSDVEWLNYAQLRLAYAQTAGDTDPYRTGSRFYVGSFSGSPTMDYYKKNQAAVIPPLNLEPQFANSYDIGFNLGLFDNRLNIDFTYYYINSYNQILDTPIPVSSGANKYTFNTGELENKGVELQINATVMQKKDFSWNVLFNYARNNNYVVALDDKAEFLLLANQWGAMGVDVMVKPGERYGTIYGYDYLRNNKGEKQVSDDGHHYLTTAEKVPLGNATPKFIGGLMNNFKYKNFSLNVLIDAQLGGDVFAGTYATSLFYGQSPITAVERNGGGLPYTNEAGVTTNTGLILEGVHVDGTKNETVVNPIWLYMGNMGSAWGDRTALVDGKWQNYKFLHTETVLDNSWVKLRQVSLTYEVPKEFIKKTKVFQSLNFQVVGRDLLYLYQSMPDNINPEGLANVGNGQGIEWGAMPGFSSFTFGINASF